MEIKMGMFDSVNFSMECPQCGEQVGDFQSKDDLCELDLIEPDHISEFYASCGKCKLWIHFYRPLPEKHKSRKKSLTQKEVEKLGFVMETKPR